MERSQILLSILPLLFVFGAHAADDVPKRSDFNRYKGMLERSPFAVATAAAMPAATPNWSKDLYVANAARTPDSDYVTIISAGDRNMKEYLSTKGPNERGYAIANIQWSDKPGETKVTISKDGQFATLPFNQSLLTPTPGQQPQSTGAVISPGAVPPVQTNIPRPPIPAVATPVPHVRPVIQRNPSAQAAPAQTPYMPPAVED